MINSKTVDGIHRPKYVVEQLLWQFEPWYILRVNLDYRVPFIRPEANNKYTEEERMLLKHKDMGYIFQAIQSERKVCGDFEIFKTNEYFVFCG